MRSQDGDLTASKGTLLFSAPELLVHKPYDASIDVWAFGCVLVCLYRDALSPYAAEDLMDESRLDLSEVISGKQCPALDTRHPMQGFVRDCSKHDPAARPPASELARQLAAVSARPS